MLSIEKDAYAEECFQFNKPYKCVRLDFRNASEVLPELEWDPKTIVWLDYDGKLDDETLSDITSVSAKICSGSVLVISANVTPESDPDEQARAEYTKETGLIFSLDDYRLRELRNRIGQSLPPEVLGSELRGKGLAKISRRVINSTLEETLSARNSLVAADKKLIYRQIFNFIYRDGALMLTTGGVFFEKGDENKFDACGFSDLDFVRTGEEPYVIEVPCLTMKEIRHLNAQLPNASMDGLAVPGVPPSDIERYAELYRYFPAFVEAIFT
jgi:hypothetical protein